MKKDFDKKQIKGVTEKNDKAAKPSSGKKDAVKAIRKELKVEKKNEKQVAKVVGKLVKKTTEKVEQKIEKVEKKAVKAAKKVSAIKIVLDPAVITAAIAKAAKSVTAKLKGMDKLRKRNVETAVLEAALANLNLNKIASKTLDIQEVVEQVLVAIKTPVKTSEKPPKKPAAAPAPAPAKAGKKGAKKVEAPKKKKK